MQHKRDFVCIFLFREYNVVLVVKPKSSLVGKTIEQSGATHQPGLHLLQVVRDGNRITTPPADFIIQAKDHLQFSGVIDSVLSLTRFDGLALSEDEVWKFFRDFNLTLEFLNFCILYKQFMSLPILT